MDNHDAIANDYVLFNFINSQKSSKKPFLETIIWNCFDGLAAYLGASENIPSIVGFIIGIGAWIYLLYEIFSGEVGRSVARSGNKPIVNAYGSMRIIVTVVWAIYPLGYIFGYITNSADDNLLNIIYNIADFINKIVFGFIVWAAAVQNTTQRSR